jgi:hypothetical protein
VDAGDRPWRERAVASAAGTQEEPVEVVDVCRGELGHVQMAEMRGEIAVDHGAGVAGSGYCPAGRCGLEPAVKQIGEGAGSDPGPTSLGDQVLELPAGEA